MKDWVAITWIIVLSTLLRVLALLNHIFDPNYHFIGTSVPYYLKADSFHYFFVLNGWGLSKGVIYILPYLFTILGLVLVYYICKRLGMNEKLSMFATLFLSFFFYFYDQTLIGFVDTPHIIHSFIIFLIWIYIYIDKYRNTWKYYIGLCIMFLLLWYFRFIWSGWRLLIGMFVFIIVYHHTKSVKWYSIITISILPCILLLLTKFRSLLFLKDMGVKEYISADYILYYIFGIILIIFYLSKHNPFKDIDFNKFLFLGFMFNFIISFFLLRVASFTIIFGTILYFNIFNETKNKNMLFIIICIFVINLVFMISLIISYTPIMDRSYEEVLLTMKEGISVVNFWDNGHLIQSISGLEHVYTSTPHKNSTVIFVKGITLSENEGVTYLDQVNRTPSYYLFIANTDINKATYFSEGYNENSIINKAFILNQSLDYFELLTQRSFEEREYRLYKRRN